MGGKKCFFFILSGFVTFLFLPFFRFPSFFKDKSMVQFMGSNVDRHITLISDIMRFTFNSPKAKLCQQIDLQPAMFNATITDCILMQEIWRPFKSDGKL